jgi:hypothetical protein
MVASVPELPNRHNGSRKRRASSAETVMTSAVGWAKCVPSLTREVTARTTAGCVCPTTLTPNPACRSTYSDSSASQTCEPAPRSIHTVPGGASCQLDATPPARLALADSVNRCDWRVRFRKMRSCSAISRSRATRSGESSSVVTVGALDIDIRSSIPPG